MIPKLNSLRLILIGLLISFIHNINAQNNISIPVLDADGGDDAEERVSSGNVLLTSSDLEIYTDGSNEQIVGIRFQNVPIPYGSIITNAYVQFQTDEVSTGVVNINIAGEAIANSSIFTNSTGNISSRTKTTNNVTWSPPDWNNVGDRDVDQQTPNLKDIVQEIIDLSGWSQNNALSFIFSAGSGAPNTRVAEDGDNASQSPVLHISFLAPGLNVIGNGHSIIDGDSSPNTLDGTSFVNTTIGVPQTQVFEIYNIGNITNPDIDLTGTPMIEINGSPNFTVLSQPSTNTINPGNNVSFTIQYTPTSEGFEEADITFDFDAIGASSFTFKIRGNAISATTLISNGEWKYLDDDQDPGASWNTIAFDDSNWHSGFAELGFGDGDETTVVADVNQVTTYFRKSFNATANDLLFNALVLNAIRDDGMVVYLNGVEVWRDNMPAGSIAHNTLAAGAAANEDQWLSTTISNALVLGENVIAVEIHQVSANNIDISFNFSMDLANTIITSGEEWSYLDDGSDQGTAWTTSLDYLTIPWDKGNAELGYSPANEDNATTQVNYITWDGGSKRNVTTYFRKQVNVSAIQAANSTLVLKARRDDGMVVYINGTEVWRDNMPGGNILFDTVAERSVSADEEEELWLYIELPNMLIAGINEIAVEIHQYNDSPTSDNDIRFDFQMYTNNDSIYITPAPFDKDNDTVADYIDSDDDNDGIPDFLEGCYTVNLKGLHPTGDEDDEASILGDFPINNHPMGNGQLVNISTSGTFEDLTSYFDDEQGWSLKVEGPNAIGSVIFDFNSNINNLFFKLTDFDSKENWTVNVYDDTNTLIDLSNTPYVYMIGTNVVMDGNSFYEKYNGENISISGRKVLMDIYGSVYFYFPNQLISRVEFVVEMSSSAHVAISHLHFCLQDTDGDLIEDYNDLDSDNDGISDLVESGGFDTNGDGLIDNLADNDSDGIPDIYDSDPNNYNSVEQSIILDYDFDNDGLPNRIDLDADNDGIVDILEIQEPDSDGNGLIDGFIDMDSNGLHDNYEGPTNPLITGGDSNADGVPDSYTIKNIDNTGLPNFADIDADDDGITDNTEAQPTNSFTAYTLFDSDGDGILDPFDGSDGWGGQGLIPVDTDIDCIPDYLDTNSDDDLEDDIIEGHDTNGDGIIDMNDTPNADTGIYTGLDDDNDGLDNGFDNNDSTYDASNTNLQPADHPNFDGLYDRDWRCSISPIDFDGVDDFVDFGNKLNLSGQFSIEAWILQKATSSYATIFSKRDIKTGNERGYHLMIDGSNHLNLTWYDNAGVKAMDITASHPILNNKWYHVAAIYDGTNAKLFVDGIEVASANTTTPTSIGTEKAMLGAMFNSDDSCNQAFNHFNGHIDEVRIWNIALDIQQLKEMMNQEISNNAGAVRGNTIPIDISGGLAWNNLTAYYNMDDDCVVDKTNNLNNGFPKNIISIQPQNAPLPYTSKQNGNWNDNSATSPWSFGDTVWNLPNSIGIDGITPIDWNIVETNHNISIDTYTNLGRERKVLGLIVAANELNVDGDTALGTGNGLTITNYLKLNGSIDLDGESQLIQSENSILDPTSAGELERDQQGTKDLYTYNYWSSPVGVKNTTSNNNDYTLPDILNDGTNPNTSMPINWISSEYDGNDGSPIGIADYWIWKFANQLSDNYPSWQHVRSTGSLKTGEGFTMKGTANTNGNVANNQNYIFIGKPNNGDINLTLSAGNDYLIGNPYPSAIDADQFILDNGPTIEGPGATTGTLYFWEHWGGGSHNLADYQGGYAMYNLSGGVPSSTIAVNDPDVANGGTPSKIPGRYIPIGQGFFVVAENAGGTISFKNNQRIFQKENPISSVYFRLNSGKTALTSLSDTTNVDIRKKIRLGFRSPEDQHRQILLTEDPRATLGYDYGFDGKLNESQKDDFFWLIEEQPYLIQGVDQLNKNTSLPIGVKNSVDGICTFILEGIENISNETNIYLYDNELQTYHDFKSRSFELWINAGNHHDRFSLVFSRESFLEINTHSNNYLIVYYDRKKQSVVINNPKLINVNTIEFFNLLGQQVVQTSLGDIKDCYEIKTAQTTGAYLVKLNTNNGTFVKKIIIKQ